MKKQHSQLIRFLCEQVRPLLARELAQTMDASIRSIKTYVSELNLISEKKLIYSSKLGYTINREQAAELLSHKEELPQTSDERIHYIVKQLCIEHTTKIDLFDLCETLYVSYSTLKTDISRMNKTLSDFDVQFVVKNDVLILNGSERSKRKLASHVIYTETGDHFTDASIIKGAFKTINVGCLEIIIRDTFKKYGYYLNDFSFINLLLHLSIIIDRVTCGNYIEEQEPEPKVIPEPDGNEPFLTEVYSQLEEGFNIQLTLAECSEIHLFINANSNYSAMANQEILQAAIGDDVYILTISLIRQIKEAYYIDLYSESFITPFALHIKNLLIRARNNRYSKNPMVQTIRSSYPTIYDIAIFISIRLMQQFSIRITEDEVAFLALHIGAEIERNNKNYSKVKCILYCPDYVHIGSHLHNQLLLKFGTEITIVKSISSLEDLPDQSFDLLITTISIKELPVKCQVLVIPPFFQQVNQSKIYEVFSRIRQNKKHYIVKKHFDHFFSHQLFLENPKEESREPMIHRLCTMLEHNEYVADGFEANVMKREYAASTAFGNIAIPHSMEMEAMKTSIAVALCKNGLEWEGQTVYLVMLIAINKGTKHLFYELYESLVELFSSKEIIETVRNCVNFEEFRNIICQYIAKPYEE